MAEIKRKVSEFSFNELFYSRTNKKGLIASGNRVFEKVSKYNLSEMLGKPHNIVRHPDMPRGVFYLLWDYLKAERPIGAYVVNLAKDQSEYWVFALALPIPEGYLSIRLKPSSAFFTLVKDKYQDLLAIETQRQISPKESSEILLSVIESLGFPNYDVFVSEALALELESRHRELKLPEMGILVLLKNFLEKGQILQEKAQQIDLAYRKSSLVSLNLDLQSAKIGSEALAISAVSVQYRKVSDEIQTEIAQFVALTKRVIQKVQRCQFALCIFLLQSEMTDLFLTERHSESIDHEIEKKYLKDLTTESIQYAKEQLQSVKAELEAYRISYEEVRKLAMVLEIVGIVGKIEVAKLKTDIQSLLQLMDDLNHYKNTLKFTLAEIQKACTDLGDMTKQIYGEIELKTKAMVGV
ncbi:PAS domain-containing protein [Bdellovibrio sp. ArHS]|uniref:PAS domain-containing protein n=1 Tax=Bdellovibrio sp. ArHS TaxID=1569284 RepID=UPI000ACE09C8|nr:PAS domain-containing protein [Bdellovibrio sp. ArHS]